AVVHERLDARRVRVTEHLAPLCRQYRLGEQSRADRVPDLVVEVGDGAGQLHDLAPEGAGAAPCLCSHGLARLRVLQDALARLRREVQSPSITSKAVDDAQRLLVVAESLRQQGGQRLLARVPEGRVAEVVTPR